MPDATSNWSLCEISLDEGSKKILNDEHYIDVNYVSDSNPSGIPANMLSQEAYEVQQEFHVPSPTASPHPQS